MVMAIFSISCRGLIQSQTIALSDFLELFDGGGGLRLLASILSEASRLEQGSFFLEGVLCVDLCGGWEGLQVGMIELAVVFF